MKTEGKRRHSVLKIVLIVLCAVAVLAAAAFFIYVGNYYHADASATEALESTGDVTVTAYSGKIVFEPAGDGTPDLHTGFIFYPGALVEYTAYAPLMAKLARRGVTCVLLQAPFNLAILNVNAADGVIDAQNARLLRNGGEAIGHWYIGGHSFGGSIAAMYLQRGHADAYDGLILLASYPTVDISGLDLSVLTVTCENDGVIRRDKYEAARAYLPSCYVSSVIAGGCHAYFGSYGRQDGDGEAAITADEQQETTADIIVDWLQEQAAQGE